MDTNAIEAKDLKKVYRANTADPVRALDGISFQVPQGCVFGLLGPNGAGKTTLVKILTTITPPTSGQATVLDAMLRDLRWRYGGRSRSCFSRPRSRLCSASRTIF